MRIATPVWLISCVLLGACNNDDAVPPAPPGKVTLRVSGLYPVGGVGWQEPADGSPAEPASIVIGPDRTLGVLLTIENFSLRTPNACGGAVQCGYDQVTLIRAADGSVALGPVQAASTAFVLDLAELDPLAGDYLVHPELLNPDGTPFTTNFAEEPMDLPATFTATGCAAGSGGEGGNGNGCAPAEAGAAGITGG